MHLLQTLEHPYALAAEFSRDGTRLVTAGMNNDLTVWQTVNWNRETHINAHDKSVNALVLSLDGRILVTGSSDCTAAIRSFPGLEERHQVRDRKKVVSGLAISPDTNLFAICSYGGRVAAWDFDGQPAAGFKANQGNLTVVAFWADSTQILAGGLGGELTIWSFPGGEPLGVVPAHDIALSALKPNRANGQVWTLGYEGQLKVWDAAGWHLVRSAKLSDERIMGCRLDLERRRAVVLTAGRIRLFDLDNWTWLDAMEVDSNVLTCAAWSSDGTTIAVGSADRRLRILAVG
jgi:WD40 repeat protein